MQTFNKFETKTPSLMAETHKKFIKKQNAKLHRKMANKSRSTNRKKGK